MCKPTTFPEQILAIPVPKKFEDCRAEKSETYLDCAFELQCEDDDDDLLRLALNASSSASLNCSKLSTAILAIPSENSLDVGKGDWSHCGLTADQKAARHAKRIARREARKLQAAQQEQQREKENESHSACGHSDSDCESWDDDYYCAKEAGGRIQRGAGKKSRGHKAAKKVQYSKAKRNMQRAGRF